MEQKYDKLHIERETAVHSDSSPAVLAISPDFSGPRDFLRIFGRYGTFHTSAWKTDFTGRLKTQAGTFETTRNAQQFSSDLLYMLTPATVLDVRFAWGNLNDTYSGNYPGGTYRMSDSDLASLWPNNSWYKPYIDKTPYVFYPYLQFPGASFSRTTFFIGEPSNYITHVRLSQQRGAHYLKYWKVSRRLTLNLGLRYEYCPPSRSPEPAFPLPRFEQPDSGDAVEPPGHAGAGAAVRFEAHLQWRLDFFGFRQRKHVQFVQSDLRATHWRRLPH
jgi:hypothetical protein